MNKKNILWIYLLLVIGLILILTNSCNKNDDNELATCSDGIQNQGETGIDCGGPCPPCISARDSLIIDYNNNYLGSNITNLGWTGSISTCDAGTVPQSTHDKVIMRLNYFRRLVGLNDNTTLDVSQFAKFQETALMMAANGQLDHYPPNTWTCWTQAGSDGAAQSNLVLTHSTPAITIFIQDPGSNNFDCGHRRWILHSVKTKFSYGTTNTSMALGVIGVADGNTNIPPFIAYPPKGYIPQQLVFSRWSFGIPGANFSSANVSMTGSNGTIILNVVSTTANYGDKTIVWEPQGIITNSPNDLSYTVTVSGITNAPQSSYTYTVIIIKP
ncbi:hypothetical protein ACFLRZ_00465 [Bacteroidota bacterium]